MFSESSLDLWIHRFKENFHKNGTDITRKALWEPGSRNLRLNNIVGHIMIKAPWFLILGRSKVNISSESWIMKLTIVSLLHYQHFLKVSFTLLITFWVILLADRQTDINAGYHITSLAEVNMPQKRLAKQARGQRCLLNLVLLRVCSDSCGSGCRIQDFSISLPQISSYLSLHFTNIYIIAAFSVSPLFPCLFPYTDEIMALISFQLFKGASGRHSRTNP